jgi:hypothetical protein
MRVAFFLAITGEQFFNILKDSHSFAWQLGSLFNPLFLAAQYPPEAGIYKNIGSRKLKIAP